jgi:putative tryptophan/tyrosine transport system substrate-binding protein
MSIEPYRTGKAGRPVRAITMEDRLRRYRVMEKASQYAGINLLTSSLEAKRIGLLHELVPGAVSMGYLMNPNYAAAEDQLAECKEAARVLGLRTVVVEARGDNEVDAAFDSFAAQGVGTLAVGADPFFDTRRTKLVALAAQHRLPTGYQSREYAG